MQMDTEKGTRRNRLTGKMASFVDKYLGEARFNASLAAKLAGYKATSKHSFESIGSENLTKPQIRKVIEDYWRMSRMSAEEVLLELGTIARSDSKDKIRALALLASHFGLLDGNGAERYGGPREPVKLTVRYEEAVSNAIVKVYGDLDTQVEQYNAKVQKHNDLIAGIFNEMTERYKDSPDAIAALTELRTRAQASEMSPEWSSEAQPEASEPIEPEIIPPDRRLRPAAVERLMKQLDNNEPEASPVQGASPNDNGRVRAFGYCLPVDGEEVERIKDHDKGSIHREIRIY